MQALNIVENPRFETDKSAKIQALKSDQIAVDALYLKPGQAHGPHRAPERDRAVVVVAGTGQLVLHVAPVDQRIDLTPGMVALAPRGVWHAVVNTGTENLVVAMTAQFPVRLEERG